jgi:hypothetical protein
MAVFGVKYPVHSFFCAFRSLFVAGESRGGYNDDCKVNAAHKPALSRIFKRYKS